MDIKSYFYNAPIETPNSPPTFNLSVEQIEKLNEILERWKELEDINEDIQTIIGEEVFERMEQKFETLENKIEERLEEYLINSPFEEFNLFELDINLDFILWLILFFILGYLFFFIIEILLFKHYK